MCRNANKLLTAVIFVYFRKANVNNIAIQKFICNTLHESLKN